MEIKDLEKQYKKIQKQLYYRKKKEALKANPEAYEEFKRKDRERQRTYYWAKKKQNTEPVKKSATVEELKAEIRRLKCKENSKKYYAKIKADPERYSKLLELNKERLRKYRAKKKAEKAVVKAAEDVVNQPVPDVNEPHWNYPQIIGIANNEADKNIVVGEDQVGTVNEEGDIENVNLYNASADNTEPEDEEVAKAYENFINSIKAYVPNVINTFEIYKAFGDYVKAYEKVLKKSKQALLDEITKLFNK